MDSEVSGLYVILYILYLNLVDLVKGVLSVLNSLQNIEDPVPPSGDDRDAITDKPNRPPPPSGS